MHLQQCSQLNAISTSICGDDTQYLKAFSDLPSYCLSRRMSSSSRHKKIIGDALQSLIIENARHKLCGPETYNALKNENAVRPSNLTRSTMIPASIGVPYGCCGF